MSGGVYGGDEVGAVVMDPGSHTFRVGFGGEEFPKFDLPSVVGVREFDNETSKNETPSDETAAKNRRGVGQAQQKREYFVGTSETQLPRANTEIRPFIKDGLIEDWDAFEAVIDHVYKKCLFSESKNHSVLFTEPAWNVKEKREKLGELMFEKWDAPSFFLMNNAVLTAFANGRTTGLVLDSGATHTSAVPVYNGYCIKNAVVHIPIGGDFIVEHCFRMLEREGIEIVPHYKIASKREVKDGEPSVWEPRKTLPPNLTNSYEDHMKKLVVEDLAQSILQLCDTPIDVEFMEKLPAANYGFPCGYKKDFLAERAKIPEALFDLKYMNPAACDEPRKAMMNIAEIAVRSCGMCEVDIRPSMYSTLMVTGGNSLIMGFTDRLNYDLAHKCSPAAKLRLTAPPTPSERRFGAWIGGSIVSSLGTFQQLWISKGEYEEVGRNIVERKCT